MTLTDDIETIDQTIGRIAPTIDTYRRKIREHRRGGHTSNSLGGGTRGSDPPLPLPDRDDRHLDHELAEVQHHARQARQHLTTLERLILARITPTRPLDEPAPRICDNPTCARTVGDPHGPDPRRYHGSRRLCTRCYQHAVRHDGSLWPRRKDGNLVQGWTQTSTGIQRPEPDER